MVAAFILKRPPRSATTLAVNIEIKFADIGDAPEFAARSGLVKARELFGARSPALLDELTDALVT